MKWFYLAAAMFSGAVTGVYLYKTHSFEIASWGYLVTAFIIFVAVREFTRD